MAKPWKDIKHKKDRKALPPLAGLMQCNRAHQWNVVDLNPEREVVLCPVCGGPVSIKNGFQRHEQR